MLFLSYVQCKPSDESNQLDLKFSQLLITECLCSLRGAFTARVQFKITRSELAEYLPFVDFVKTRPLKVLADSESKL